MHLLLPLAKGHLSNEPHFLVVTLVERAYNIWQYSVLKIEEEEWVSKIILISKLMLSMEKIMVVMVNCELKFPYYAQKSTESLDFGLNWTILKER